MDDGLALGHGDAEGGFGERAADAEDDVGVTQKFRHRARHGEAAGAERQRMRLGERRFAAEAGGDGNGEPFGEPLQLRPRLGVMHALAGIDHRPLGADQQRRRFLHMHGIGAVARAQHRRVVQRLRHLLVPHVGRDFDDHRSAAAVLQLCEGAAKNVADFAGQDDRLGRFRKRLHRLAGIEVGVDIGEPARIAHRQHQHGHRFAVALRDAAHRVLGARAVLHAEGADGVAGGDARDRVRHVNADAFLAHHDRADVGIGGVFDQVIDRIAAEDLDALALHDFRDRSAELHDGLSPCGRPVGPADLATVGTGFCGSVKPRRRLPAEVLICVCPLVGRRRCGAGDAGAEKICCRNACTQERKSPAWPEFTYRALRKHHIAGQK